MNGFNAQYGSGQGFGSLSSNSYGNQQVQGTLSIEQYSYSNGLDLADDQSRTVKPSNKVKQSDNDAELNELVIENVAKSAIAQAQIAKQEQVSSQAHSQEKPDLPPKSDATVEPVQSAPEAKSNNSNQVNKSEQPIVPIKSKKKHKAKNKANNAPAEKLANEPHNKEVKVSAPIVHVDEAPVRENKTQGADYYEFSIPFGRRTRLPVMNEPNGIKHNIGLTQTSFERFDHAPVMRVAAYGFSGIDYTQIARNKDSQEYLLEEIRAHSALHDNEVPFSHANEHNNQSFYYRDHNKVYPTSSIRSARALSMRTSHNMNNQFVSSGELKQFYSAQKTINGTRLSIKAFTTDSSIASVNSTKSTTITKMLPLGSNLVRESSAPALVEHKKELSESYKQQLALQKAEQEKLQAQAHEIHDDIMEQGHTILSGQVSVVKPEQKSQQSIIVVRSKPGAFETSGEVKTIIRNRQALALHGSNAARLAEQDYIRLCQQVTLPEDYLFAVEQNDNEPNVFESSPRTLLGTESTRIVSTTRAAAQEFGQIFQPAPQLTNQSDSVAFVDSITAAQPQKVPATAAATAAADQTQAGPDEDKALAQAQSQALEQEQTQDLQTAPEQDGADETNLNAENKKVSKARSRRKR